MTEEEFAAVAWAAERLGMALGAYAGEAAVAAARNVEPPQWSPLRDMLSLLMQAADQVRRVGVNLNQAVAALHSTGHPAEALQGYAAVAARTLERLDDLTDEIWCRLP
ncbi:MAG: hypothetical protein JWL97_3467 [Gemmatimonadales bacterium]|jgi:hypothetical protein|nr:hypothetical protein [Gemmatimonadales bacterium]